MEKKIEVEGFFKEIAQNSPKEWFDCPSWTSCGWEVTYRSDELDTIFGMTEESLGKKHDRISSVV